MHAQNSSSFFGLITVAAALAVGVGSSTHAGDRQMLNFNPDWKFTRSDPSALLNQVSTTKLGAMYQLRTLTTMSIHSTISHCPAIAASKTNGVAARGIAKRSLRRKRGAAEKLSSSLKALARWPKFI